MAAAAPGRQRLQAGSSGVPTPPSGSQPQDMQPFTKLLSQDLLDGGELLTYGSVPRSSPVYRPSCLFVQGYASLLCFSLPLLALLPCPK